MNWTPGRVWPILSLALQACMVRFAGAPHKPEAQAKVWPRLAVILSLLLSAAGCGPGLYSVRGKVTFPDGTPLTEGIVVFESMEPQRPVTARGQIQADGSFELSTHRPGDGVMPGKYRVLVAPKSDPNAIDKRAKPPPFDPRYMEFGSSGWQFEVTAAGPNDFPITVTKQKKS